MRGYRESLFLIDRGVIGSLELARSFNLFPESGASSFKWGGFTASLFADGAVFRNAEEPQPAIRRISSVGVALAWTPSDALRVSIAYGHALNKFDTPNQRSLQDRGIHFRMILHPAGIL